MISYPEEYGKVYSYSYRHKIYETPQYPSNINLNKMIELKDHTSLPHFSAYKTASNFNDFNPSKSRPSFSAYLKQRYQNNPEKNKALTNDFERKSTKK